MFMVIGLIAAIFLCPLQSARAQSHPKIYGMDSLNPYASRAEKKARYTAAKTLGMKAITLDMWWAVVEPEEGKFDWSVYLEDFEIAKEVGIKLVPIDSSHSVPQWVWKKFPDMKFKGTDGIENEQYISFFAPEAYALHRNRLRSFARTFAKYDDIIEKIYISTGPDGEGRYSYGANWEYPGIGTLQTGSKRAKESFRFFLRNEYKTIGKLNEVWGSQFESFDSLDTPNDGDLFFRDGVNTPYGKDVMRWYQGVLNNHVDIMQKMANEELKEGPHRFTAPLAAKIAGIYWLATNPVVPHAAERAAGYYDYDSLLKVFAKNNFELTFTCFEKADQNYYPFYSMAHELVGQIADIAKKYGIKISGENAEAFNLEFKSQASVEDAYINIKDIFAHYDISAFTFLRLDYLVNPDGSLKPEAKLFQKYLSPPPLLISEEVQRNLEPVKYEEVDEPSTQLEICNFDLEGLRGHHPAVGPAHP